MEAFPVVQGYGRTVDADSLRPYAAYTHSQTTPPAHVYPPKLYC
jgi:hypothetical protein